MCGPDLTCAGMNECVSDKDNFVDAGLEDTELGNGDLNTANLLANNSVEIETDTESE
jgi:hypothetical protein